MAQEVREGASVAGITSPGDNLALIQRLLVAFGGYVVWTTAFNVPAVLWPLSIPAYALLIAAFFPFAFLVARCTGLQGFPAMGLFLHPGWMRNLSVGFALGFSCWAMFYGLSFGSGALKFLGWASPTGIAAALFLALVGMFLGSLVDEMICRGFAFGHLAALGARWFVPLSAVIYAIDDSWYAGFSVENMIFSLVLGLGFGWAFWRTGSVWLPLGMHAGLNAAFVLVRGMPGAGGGGLMAVAEGPDSVSILPFAMALVCLGAVAAGRLHPRVA